MSECKGDDGCLTFIIVVLILICVGSLREDIKNLRGELKEAMTQVTKVIPSQNIAPKDLDIKDKKEDYGYRIQLVRSHIFQREGQI